MNKNKLITPEGTKDYLFEEALLKKNIENSLRSVFHYRGYNEVVTPCLEFLDVFTAGVGSQSVEQMYKLVDSKGRLMVLRPDSTMPIARLSATRLKNEQIPLRLYYNQSVFSVNPAMRGRSNESVQAGIELIGVSNKKSDIEVLVTATKALQNLNIDNFRIEIGHIEIFNSLVSALNISDSTKEEIRFFIESKNFPALNDLLDDFGDRQEAVVLKTLPRLFGGYEVFDKARKLINDKKTASVLSYLEDLYKSISELGLEDKITVDLGIVNRNDYYTGIVFKGYVEGYGEEVLSGGRYDGLIKDFGEDLGAIGFAVNIDSVVKALLNSKDHSVEPVTALVFSKGEYQIKALEYIDSLAEKNIVTEYSLCDTLDEAIAYAKSKNIGRIDVVDENIKTINL